MRYIFLCLLVASVAFVWYTGQQLPPMMASHFGATGAPNTFMSRESYIKFFLAILLLAPSLIALLGQLVRLLPASVVNLPNRSYWLAPERREATFNALSTLAIWFGCFLLVFLSFVHWLVVRANLSADKELDTPLLLGGLAVLLITFATWMIFLLRRFARIS